MSELAVLFRAIADVDWIETAIIGKAKKPLPSVLTETGFIAAIIRESKAIQQHMGKVIGTKEFKEQLKKSTTLNWKTAKAGERTRAINATANLMKGLPSEFAPGVRAILDEQGKLVFDNGHLNTAKKTKSFRVDPVFSLRNQRAVDALKSSTSIFFPDEYVRQASRFRARSRNVLSDGLSQGLGSREIGAALREEFRDLAINRNYWDTVAAVHVNRARSFSQLATYAENGVVAYEVIAIMDRRTTDICQMMNGTQLPVEAALNAFDQFEDAISMGQAKQALPFMSVTRNKETNRKEIVVKPPNKPQTKISGMDKNGFPGKIDPKAMNKAGVNAPPYHMRCRSTIAPVFGEIPVSKPITTNDTMPALKPPKKPDSDKKTPFNPGKDPVRDVPGRAKRQDAILKQIRDGRGYVPGQFNNNFIAGMAESDRITFFDKMASEFTDVGRDFVESNPQLKAAWNNALKFKNNPADIGAYTAGRENADAFVEAFKKVGLEAIPENERGDRKKAFIEEVLSKGEQGKRARNGLYVAKSGRGKNLTRKQKADLEDWAGEFFDAYGPLAEEALKRNKNIRLISSTNRAHNYADGEYFAYRDKKSFFHEFGHSIEHHVIKPRRGSTSNPQVGSFESYWHHRVKSKHPGPPERLNQLLPGYGYANHEKARADNWFDPYAGKLYEGRGSSEIVSMFSEFLAGSTGDFRKQFEKDPDALLEWIGYVISTTRGETTRRNRGGN